MTTVYLVSSGCYSDYRVCGIFSTREGAEALAAILEDANEVEEYELDRGADAIAQGFKPWVVGFRPDGTARPFQADSYLPYAIDGDVADYRNHPHRISTNNELAVYVMARDEAHALKIAQDRRAEYLAKEAGV